ncbi:hypothetical protein GCM10023350_42450 [Nocardioides endophyticus]|uniref:SnoaL-like domain-containing protein n=1 Tax=Nocardioides endophyticus TaxID=1353775 RepID=A0ABP8ZCH2_9ACTN
MTEVDPLTRLVAIADCTRLMVEYGLRLDHGVAVSTAELFTEDGAWRSNTIDAVGQAQLKAFFQRRADLTDRLTRHVVTNIAVDVLDEDHARARSYAVEIRGDRGADGLAEDTRPAVVGDYKDKLVKVDGRWLFTERLVEISFKRSTEVFMESSSS